MNVSDLVLLKQYRVFSLALLTIHFVYFILLNQIHVGDCLALSCCCLRCYGVVVVASGSSPSAYIRGLIRRIDRGDPNAVNAGIQSQNNT